MRCIRTLLWGLHVCVHLCVCYVMGPAQHLWFSVTSERVQSAPMGMEGRKKILHSAPVAFRFRSACNIHADSWRWGQARGREGGCCGVEGGSVSVWEVEGEVGLTQSGVGIKMKHIDGDVQGWLKFRVVLCFLRFVGSPWDHSSMKDQLTWRHVHAPLSCSSPSWNHVPDWFQRACVHSVSVLPHTYRLIHYVYKINAGSAIVQPGTRCHYLHDFSRAVISHLHTAENNFRACVLH